MTVEKSEQLSVKDIQLKKNGEKWKVFWYGDLGAATGFNTVTRNILDGMYKTGLFDISVLAINNWGEPDPDQVRYKIYPAVNNPTKDPYGSHRLKELMLDPDFDFDLFFVLQDTFVVEPYIEGLLNKARKEANKKFVSLFYFPIDGIPRESWVKTAAAFDCPVAYTRYGYEQCLKAYPPIEEKLSIIPHGVNTEDFYPLPEEYKKRIRSDLFSFMPNISEKFIYFRVDRNQPRKDYPRLFRGFREVLNHRPDSILYCHCMVRDNMGNKLDILANNCGLVPGRDVFFPENFDVRKGIPVSYINKLYNMSDAYVTTALGGGAELCNFESFATKTPIIAPRNTCFTEILGENEERGYLIDSGNTVNNHIVQILDNEVLRPIVDLNSLVEKMIYVQDNYKEAKQKAEAAYKWVTEGFVWEKNIVPMWLQMVKSLAPVLNERKYLAPAKVNAVNSYIL